MKTSSIANKLALGALLVGLAAGRAGATPITGSISFDASATVNDGGDLSTATAITAIQDARVAWGTQAGAYASIPNDYTPVTFQAVSSFTNAALDPQPLWTLTYNGTTYSFVTSSIAVVAQGANFLDLAGTGLAEATGWSNTAADWTIDLTTADPNGGLNIAFGASAFSPDTPVPDTGATGLLTVLGLAGLGLGLLARRRPSAA